FRNRPNVVSQTRSHSWRDAKCLVNAAKVVMHIVERDGGNMILNLLAERIGQASEAPDLHPHREILPLNVAGADVLRVRGADLSFFAARRADSGAIALLRFGIISVDLHQ